MDGSDATAAPFSFSDLRMMFIELRGASPIDRPVPVPVTLPSSPHSQYTTPPILPQNPPSPPSRPPSPPLRIRRGRSNCQHMSRTTLGSCRKNRLCVAVCSSGSSGSITPTPPPPPTVTPPHPPPPPPQPGVLVIVVIRRPLCERQTSLKGLFSLRSFFDPSGGRNGVDLQLF